MSRGCVCPIQHKREYCKVFDTNGCKRFYSSKIPEIGKKREIGEILGEKIKRKVYV